jgi:aerobic C4-dicarboxylate transport protein
LLVGTGTRSIDRDQVDRVLAGHAPFDETTMLDEHSDYHDEDDVTDGASANGAQPAAAGQQGSTGSHV